MERASHAAFRVLLTVFLLWDIADGSNLLTEIGDCGSLLETTCFHGGEAVSMSADLSLDSGNDTASFCRCRQGFFGPDCNVSDATTWPSPSLAGSLTFLQASAGLNLTHRLDAWAGGVIAVDFALVTHPQPSRLSDDPGGYYLSGSAFRETTSGFRNDGESYDVRSVAKLRYWCQGKPSCDLYEEVVFSSTNEYLQIRQNVSALDDQERCQPGCAYFPQTWTCYCMTYSEGFVEEVRDECRQRGGELARFFIGDEDSSLSVRNLFVSFLVKELSYFGVQDGDKATKSFYVHRENVGDRNYEAARNGAGQIFVWDDVDLPVKVAKVDLPWTDPVFMNSPSFSSGHWYRLRALCEVPPYVPLCLNVTIVTDPTPSPTTTPKPKFCPRKDLSEIEEGYFFPMSEGNQWVLKTCPRGWVGNATWFCRASGQWRGRLPSLRECKSPIDINESINQVNGTTDVAGLLDTLANTLGQAAEEADHPLFIAPSDLVDIARLLETAGSQQFLFIDQAADQGEKKRLASDYFKSMNGLSKQALLTTLVWETMEVEERFATATKLQVQIELGALKVAEFLAAGEEERVKQETHVVTVRKVPKKDLESGNAARWTSFGYNSSKMTLGRSGLLNQMDPSEESLGVSFFGFKNLQEILVHDGSTGTMSDNDVIRASNASIRINGINTQIIGAKVSAAPGASFRNDSDFRVILEFKNSRKVDSADPSKTWACVFWDSSRWSDEGCTKISLFDDRVVCECNHLTNFAVLMEIDSKLPPIVEEILTIATLIGCSVSIVCLVLSASIFAWVKTTTTRQIDICLCLSLAGAQILVIFGMDATASSVGCAFIAGIMHYLFLTSFAWMFIKGLDLYMKMTATLRLETRATVYYFLGGFGLPALVVGITAGFSQGDAYGSDESCWLDDLFTLTFVAPVAVVILVNFIVVGVTLRVAIRAKTGGTLKQSRSGSPPLKFALGVASLASILGLTWILGIVYIAYPHTSTAVLFTVFNSTQGIFIFAFFVVANDKTRTAVLKKSGLDRWFPRLVSDKTSASNSRANKSKASPAGEPSTTDGRARTFRRWNLRDEIRSKLQLMTWRGSIRISHGETTKTSAVSQTKLTTSTTTNYNSATPAAGVPGGDGGAFVLKTAGFGEERLI